MQGGQIRVDGVLAGTQPATGFHLVEDLRDTNSVAPYDMGAIGSYQNTTTAGVTGGREYAGDIGEIITFNVNLNAGDRALIETYLSRKWQLAVQPSSNFLPVGTALSVTGSGVLDLAGISQTIAGMNESTGPNTLSLSNNAPSATTGATLTSTGSVAFSSTSVLNMRLPGAPNNSTGGANNNDFINAGSNSVTLGNASLNIFGGPGFAVGSYRLVNGNIAAGSTLLVTSIPTGFSATVSVTTGAGGHADLLVTAGNTFTWSGLGADNNWQTTGNWVRSSDGSTTAVPTGNAFEILVFPAGPTVLSAVNNYPSGTSFSSISFTGGGYTITGTNASDVTTLNNSGLVVSSTSGANTLALNLALNALTFTTDNIVNTGTALTLGSVSSTLSIFGNSLAINTASGAYGYDGQQRDFPGSSALSAVSGNRPVGSGQRLGQHLHGRHRDQCGHAEHQRGQSAGRRKHRPGDRREFDIAGDRNNGNDIGAGGVFGHAAQRHGSASSTSRTPRPADTPFPA